MNYYTFNNFDDCRFRPISNLKIILNYVMTCCTIKSSLFDRYFIFGTKLNILTNGKGYTVGKVVRLESSGEILGAN